VLVIEAGESDAKQIFSRLPAGWVGPFFYPDVNKLIH